MRKAILAMLLATLLILSSSAVVVTAKPEPEQKPDVEKVVFVHGEVHREMPAKPPRAGPKEKRKPGKGYKLLARGVKIQNPPSTFVINPTNDDIDNENLVVDEIKAAFNEWDENVPDVNIFIYGGLTGTSGASRNDENVISFVSIDGLGGTVAQATIWYNRRAKNVIEYDIEFDLDDKYEVDPDGEGGVALTDAFDLRNIATHEAGHSLVLLDLYEDKYSEMTMYGYTTLGETKKRSIEWGDSNGIHKLYG
ncbi:MAG: matrixin family metalloprotease [Bacteroidota bacterium]